MKNPTQAQTYIPPADLVRPQSLHGLAIGVRTTYQTQSRGVPQYFVYEQGYTPESDPLLEHVIGAGGSVVQAAHSAVMHLATQKIKPQSHWGRLAGCTFSTVIEDGNVAMKYACLSPSGVELGRAERRENSAKRAMHRALVGVDDVRFNEFSAIAFPVFVERGRWGFQGPTFATSQAESNAAVMLKRMYTECESVRQGALTVAKAAQPKGSVPLDPYMVYRQASYKKILASLGKDEGTLFRLRVEKGDWEGFMVLHTSQISESDAMRHAFDDYLCKRDEYLSQISDSRMMEEDLERC